MFHVWWHGSKVLILILLLLTHVNFTNESVSLSISILTHECWVWTVSSSFSRKLWNLGMLLGGLKWLRCLFLAVNSLPSRWVNCNILEERERISVVCLCPFELLLRHMLLSVTNLSGCCYVFLTQSTRWETHSIQMMVASCVLLIISWRIKIVCHRATCIVYTISRIVVRVHLLFTKFYHLKVNYW